MIPLPKPIARIAALAFLLLAAVGATSAGTALSLGWYESGTCDDGEAANPGSPAPCRFDVPERSCADGVDNDSDERADCEDFDCVGAASCPSYCQNEAAENVGHIGECVFGEGSVSCRDNYDNDGDLSVDCNDSDCGGHPDCACALGWNPTSWLCLFGAGAGGPQGLADAPAGAPLGSELPPSDSVPNQVSDLLPKEICEPRSGVPAQDDERRFNVDAPPAQGILEVNPDEDGDGLVDCDDPDCHTCDPEKACYKPGDPRCGEVCDNGVDDDGDGSTDCEDNDCVTCDKNAPCYEPDYLFCNEHEYDCQDGWDNDNDGAADCADEADCFFREECARYERCDDNYDNDDDGDVDCADSDCAGAYGCGELFCDDGRDNDNDGYADCTDGDCIFSDTCAEQGEGGSDCDDLRRAISEIESAIAELERNILWLQESAESADASRNFDSYQPGPSPDGLTVGPLTGGDIGQFADAAAATLQNMLAQRQALIDRLGEMQSILAACESAGF